MVEHMRPLLDLVLPTRCAGCGDPAGPGCPRCLSALAAPARWTRPTPAPAGLPPVATIAAYDGAVRALLIGYKEHGISGLARPLGIALARAVQFAIAVVAGIGPARPLGPIVVVPVPSSPRQCRRRGADVVADLAARAAHEVRRTGRQVEVVRALRHRRTVADSAGLDARARAANAVGALGLRRGAGPLLAGRTVIVVDDLVTTGASLTEAARVLRAASAGVAAAATVAATARHASPRGSGGTGLDGPRARGSPVGLHNRAGGHYRAEEDSRRLEEAPEWTSS